MIERPNFLHQSMQQILDLFHVTVQNGLSSQQVQESQQKYGRNILPEPSVTWVTILLRQCASPFFYLLAGASMLSFVLGEVLDGTMIIVFMLVTILLGFYQEYHAEHTIQMLKKLLVLKARVRRDGKEQEIPTSELVCGDIIILEPGDIIPADIRFIEGDNISIDESLISGESMPVVKVTESTGGAQDDQKKTDVIGYAGSVVLTGKAIGIITAIGEETELGTITHLASNVRRDSLFVANMRKLSSLILVVVVITLAMIVVLQVFVKGSKINVIDLILFAVALAVSIVPETLPMVMSFCFARGAARLAKNHVIVRRLSAIEDLGSIEVLCCDKTGTLTENILSVADVFGKQEEVLGCALQTNESEEQHDLHSFDGALVQAIQKLNLPTTLREKVRFLPFDPLSRSVHVIVADGQTYRLIVRGSPDVVLSRCSGSTKEAQDWALQQGLLGNRVLAVAIKKIEAPDALKNMREEKALECIGLISFTDPIKSTVQQSLQKAQQLGVKIKVITGDAPEVAGAVGKQINLINDVKAVLLGDAFEKLSDDEQKQALESYAIFARVNPQQKFEMIKKLQANYKVGFLGEGINDAPALKIAHVALVVENGTDIAKDAADIILQQKSLRVIVNGIEEGRKIVANTMKYLDVVLASNFSNFYTIALISLVIDFLPMLPLQILLVNFISDVPLTLISTDVVDTADISKPQAYNFSSIVVRSIIFGIVCSIFDFILIAFFINRPHAILQTTWFMFNVFSELIFFLAIRSRKSFVPFKHLPRQLSFFIVLALVFSMILPLTFMGQQVFSFVAPKASDYGIMLGVIGAMYCVIELSKQWYNRWFFQKIKKVNSL